MYIYILSMGIYIYIYIHRCFTHDQRWFFPKNMFTKGGATSHSASGWQRVGKMAADLSWWKPPPEACLVRVQGVEVSSTSERSSHRVQKTWNPRHRSSLTNTCGFGKRGPHEKMAQEWDTPMYPRNWSFCHYLYQDLTTIRYMLK